MKNLTFVFLVAMGIGGFHFFKKFVFPSDQEMISQLVKEISDENIVRFQENPILSAKRGQEIAEAFLVEPLDFRYLPPTGTIRTLATTKAEVARLIAAARTKLTSLDLSFSEVQMNLEIGTAELSLVARAEGATNNGRFVFVVPVSGRLEKTEHGWKLISGVNTGPVRLEE